MNRITPQFLLFILLGAMALLVVNAAMAAQDTVKIVWDAPTQRVNGEPLSVDEISKYHVYYSADGISEKTAVAQSPETEIIIGPLDPANYKFQVSTIDTNGLESNRSDPYSLSLIPSNFPGNIRVFVTVTVEATR